MITSRDKPTIAWGLNISALLIVLAMSLSSAVFAQQEIQLLDIDAGQIPNDTGLDNQTQLTIKDYARLGGNALEVIFASRDSFGNNNSGERDWSGYRNFSVTVDNPSREERNLTFVIRNVNAANERTRVNVPLTLTPGINFINVDISELRTTDGEMPNWSYVRQWYIATGSDTPTLYFKDFKLSTMGQAEMQVANLLLGILPDQMQLARRFRVTGSVGDEVVDLTLEPQGAAGASATANTQSRSNYGDPLRIARVRSTTMPAFESPELFNTPLADSIVSALEVFPEDNAFNQIVSTWPKHENSDNIVSAIGLSAPMRANRDMAYVLVPPNQAFTDMEITTYASSSDPGPYPIPDNMPIEGWPVKFNEGIIGFGRQSLLDVQQSGTGDRHAIVVDPVNRMLYEFANVYRAPIGWTATQASIFDLSSNKLRPDGWTSSDAAGLPIFPAVVRYDELARGEIEHAMRVTAPQTRRDYVAPATHYASGSNDMNLPRMGERLRLRADFDLTGFSTEAKTILRALKKYGMFVADNGNAWAISVAPDQRIPDMARELRQVRGSDFEVVTAPE